MKRILHFLRGMSYLFCKPQPAKPTIPYEADPIRVSIAPVSQDFLDAIRKASRGPGMCQCGCGATATVSDSTGLYDIQNQEADRKERSRKQAHAKESFRQFTTPKRRK